MRIGSQNLCARLKSLIEFNEAFIPYNEMQPLDRSRADVYYIWISDTGS